MEPINPPTPALLQGNNMPAIYMSYEITPEMTVQQKQSQLYLGVISAGEQAYTLGAAIAECRKQLTSLDELVTRLRNDFHVLKEQMRNTCPRCGSPMKDEICQNYGCEGQYK